MDRTQRTAFRDQLRQRSAELIANTAERQQRYEQSGEAADDLLARQRDPRAETDQPQQQPQAYRTMSDAELAPWRDWFKRSFDERVEIVSKVIFDRVAEALNERDEVIRKLEKEVAALTESRRSWWSGR